eukprot:CAMPEP_0174857576 /NCGR_PEP_ID=MMETSP1114-20130205/39475_1 /TAXON_ID=312471 /ORGANISM="Neobodo designis, Strain CCAP 1951/1" /LENGTH=117 /DNA_ID=CAMNT_0016092439 /DNA_START=35 /DNA_END=384 /DNA_ORIENTATION=-
MRCGLRPARGWEEGVQSNEGVGKGSSHTRMLRRFDVLPLAQILTVRALVGTFRATPARHARSLNGYWARWGATRGLRWVALATTTRTGERGPSSAAPMDARSAALGQGSGARRHRRL